jgi:hypothetical protein
MKWSGREDTVLGRSFDLLVVPINMYKNRYDTIAILVSMFGGCSEGYSSWRIRWVTPPQWPKTWSKIWFHLASKRPRHLSEGPLCYCNIQLNSLFIEIICCWTILVPLMAIVRRFSGFVPSWKASLGIGSSCSWFPTFSICDYYTCPFNEMR